MKKINPGETTTEKGIMLTQQEALDFVETKKKNTFLDEKVKRYEEITAANALKEQRNKGRVEGAIAGSAATYVVLALLSKGRSED